MLNAATINESPAKANFTERIASGITKPLSNIVSTMIFKSYSVAVTPKVNAAKQF